MAVFLADPGPPLNGRRDRADLHGVGCRYGSSGSRVVHAASQRGPATAGPIPAAWAAGGPARSTGSARSAGCRSARCGPRTPGTCSASPTRRGGASWAAPTARTTSRTACCAARPASTSAGWRPQLRLELQYAVQCRHDQATITAAPPVVTLGDPHGQRRRGDLAARPPARAVAGAGRARSEGNYQRFPGLRPRRRRDPARRHRLGGRVSPRRLAAAPPARADPSAGKRPQARIHLRFDRIAQPWLRDAGQTLGPAAAERRASASAPCRTTSRA